MILMSDPMSNRNNTSPTITVRIKLLMIEEIPPNVLRSGDSKDLIPPLYGALLKNEQDVHMLERLAFLNRREGS